MKTKKKTKKRRINKSITNDSPTIPDSQFPIPALLPTPYSLNSPTIPDSQFPIPAPLYSRPTPYSLLPTPFPMTNIKALIADKHRQREDDSTQAENTTAKPGRAEARDIFQHLSNEPIYLLETKIIIGRQSIKILGEELGIDGEVLEQLREIARGGYGAKISQKLKNHASKLQSQEKTWQNRYTVYAEPYRFVHESHYPDAIAAIEAMQSLADELRQDLINSYDAELEHFLVKLQGVMEKAGLSEIEVSEALYRYADSYPTPEDWAENALQVSITQNKKISSFIESLQQDTKVAKAAADKALAELDADKAKLEQEKFTAIARSTAIFTENLNQAVNEGRTRARDDAYDALADFFDKIALCQPGDIPGKSRTIKGWDNAFARLEVLAAHDPNLSGIIEEAREIRELYENENTNISLLHEKLQGFQRSLQNLTDADNTGGKGNARLSKMLTYEAQYRDAIAELKALEQNPDPERISELKGKIESLASLYKYRSKELEKLFTKAKVETKIAVAKHTPDSVFDEEAGF